MLSLKNNVSLEKDYFAYLIEVTQGTPSSNLKLLAIWDALSLETQIKILHHFKSSRLDFPEALKEKILNSPNEYIRYLAASFVGFNENNPKDKNWLDLIAKDTSELVKYTHTN